MKDENDRSSAFYLFRFFSFAAGELNAAAVDQVVAARQKRRRAGVLRPQHVDRRRS